MKTPTNHFRFFEGKLQQAFVYDEDDAWLASKYPYEHIDVDVFKEHNGSFADWLEWECDWIDVRSIGESSKTKQLNDELTQANILHILQNSESVLLGERIWADEKEFVKLSKIIKYAVKWAREKASEQ